MAHARKHGRYTGHMTPGDGTGMAMPPTREWHDVLDDERAEKGSNVGPIHYPQRTSQPEHGMKKARNDGTWPTGYKEMTK